MSTLAVIATSTLTGVIGAAAMYVPARLALRDARTYRDEADRTFGAAESLADEVERTRNLPWHYAIEAAPEPQPAEHEGEVLHVEHPTGELRALNAADPEVAAGLADLAEEVGLAQALDDEPEHKPTCPDLYYCPTVDEVESGCHGGFDVCCTAPELHMPIPDEHDDEDAPADDTDRPGLWLVLLAIPVALWDRAREWWRSLWAKPEPYRGRHWVAGTQHTGQYPIVPAQRDGGEN